MRPLGHVLMWGGFIAGAFVSLSQVEKAGVDKWATIPWHLYAIAMAVGIAGVFLLRITKAELEGDQETQEAEFSVLRQRLQVIHSTISGMADQRNHDPASVLRQIDDECSEPLADFADARQSIARKFGLAVYAEVMTEFASAERYINRCWSAAADGYVDEVRDCLQRAKHHLGKTDDLITAADR